MLFRSKREEKTEKGEERERKTQREDVKNIMIFRESENVNNYQRQKK